MPEFNTLGLSAPESVVHVISVLRARASAIIANGIQILVCHAKGHPRLRPSLGLPWRCTNLTPQLLAQKQILSIGSRKQYLL